jgi:hypothetical protein
LLRYNNAVNGIDLFNSALKASFKGPQSMVTGSTSNVGVRYRGLHQSYIDKISLTFSSAGDPGMTIMFTPFVEISDDFFFDNSVFVPSERKFDEKSFEDTVDELGYDDEETDIDDGDDSDDGDE